MADNENATADTGNTGNTSADTSPANWENRYNDLASKFLERDTEVSESRRQVMDLSAQVQNLAQQNQLLASQMQPRTQPEDIPDDLIFSNPKAYKEILKREIYQELTPVVSQIGAAVTGIQKQNQFNKQYADLDDADMRVFVELEAQKVYSEPATINLPENVKWEKIAHGARARAKQLHETLSRKFSTSKPPHMGGGGAGNVSSSVQDDEPMDAEALLNAYCQR